MWFVANTRERMNVTGGRICSPWGPWGHVDHDHIYDRVLSLAWHVPVSKSRTDTTLLCNSSLTHIPHYKSAWMLHHPTLTQQLAQATIPYTSVRNESYRSQWKTGGWNIPLYASAPMKFTDHLFMQLLCCANFCTCCTFGHSPCSPLFRTTVTNRRVGFLHTLSPTP